MLKVTIKKWSAAEELYQSGDFQGAAAKFSSAQETSKICYNLGVCLMAVQDYSRANQAFTRSIECDGYCCISYAARAVTWVYLGQNDAAVDDFKLTIETLRGHEHIDYGQLGLEYRLLRSDVCFNLAVVFCAMGGGRLREAKKNVDEAYKCEQIRPETKPLIENLKSTIDSGGQPNVQIVLIDSGLFQAPKLNKQPGEGFKQAKIPSPISIGGGAGSSASNAAMPSPLMGMGGNPSGVVGNVGPAPSYSGPGSNLAKTKGALPAAPGVARGGGRKSLPPPPSGKALPGKPAPGPAQDMARFKVFYKDRRLVQVPKNGPTLVQLEEAIAAKFAISMKDVLIKFATKDNPPFIATITNSADLKTAIDGGADSLYLGKEREVNTFAPQTHWTEFYSDAGERYFHNSRNDETSWGPFDPDSAGPDKPEDWEECFTEDGEKYYYNTKTQATSWDKP